MGGHKIVASLTGLQLGKGITMSVYKRGGKWHFRKRINGVRYRGALKTARNKVQAEQAESKLIFEIHQGVYGHARNKARTLNDYIDQVYMLWAKSNKRSFRADSYRVKPIKGFFGKKLMSDISPFLVEKFKRERLSTPIVYRQKTKTRSVASVNRELCLLSKILSLAVTDGEIAENPCRRVSRFKGEVSRTRYLCPEDNEQERLLAAMIGRRAHLREIVELYLALGLRQMELLSLTADMIDFHRDVVHIKNAKGYVDREVPMNDCSRAIFRKLVSQAKSEDRDFLFISPKTGQRLKSIKTAWANACKVAGIRDLRVHDLRHTFGTRAADGGAPLPAIKDVMGHKSVKTTERYTHATDEAKRRTMEIASRKVEKMDTKWTQKVARG
jgi:integrase